MVGVSPYYDLTRSKKMVENGNHRRAIGGMWDEIGKLQFEYLIKNGLATTDRLLDVGCGCLRGGVHFVDYLEPAHYFGIDISEDLLEVGYDVEIGGLKLQHKLPRKNLLTTGNFDATSFGVKFDAVLSLSVFTHLAINDIKLCLARLEASVRPGAKYFASVFTIPANAAWTDPIAHTPGGITTHPDRDPFHYTRSDLEFCCDGLSWRLDRLEAWDHPRDQWMATFVRTERPD
jgi:SAM-dependent methyltransferase